MKLYREVRSILVRHFIDLGRLSVQISMTGIYLHGSLARLPGVTAPLTQDLVRVIMAELSRVPGVRRVNAEFDNWKQDRALGAWVESGATRRPPEPPPADTDQPQVYDVNEPKE